MSVYGEGACFKNEHTYKAAAITNKDRCLIQYLGLTSPERIMYKSQDQNRHLYYKIYISKKSASLRLHMTTAQNPNPACSVSQESLTECGHWV